MQKTNAKPPAVIGVVEIDAKSRHGQAIRANPAKVCQREIERGGTRRGRENEKERKKEK